MDATDADLTAVRDACARLDWQAAFDATEPFPPEPDHEPGRPASAAERADLRAEAAWWLGRLDDCIAAREEAYRRYDELGDRRRAGQCAVWLWEHHAFAARPAMAGGWLRRARRALEDEPPCAEQGALWLREAETAHGAGDVAAAEALATRAIALGRELRSPDLEAEALQTRGRVRIDRGEVADGLGDIDEAMLSAVEGRLGPYSTGKVYCSLISACEELGDLDRAAEWTEATLRWAEQHPFAVFPGICRVHRAVVLKRRGSLAEAEQEAILACRELVGSHVGNSAAAFAEVGDIRRRLGDLDRADEAFTEAQRLSGKACGAVALLWLAQGRIDAARSIIDACLDEAANPLARVTLLPMLIHVAVTAGDLDGAAGAADDLDDIAATIGTPLPRASARSARGRLELARHDPAACTTLQEALVQWVALGVPYEVATTRTLLGQALRNRGGPGDREAATEAFAAATQMFDEIGAHFDARLVATPDEPVLPAGLTAREVEVLRLIATGLTNNDVAERLHLSAKTVSRHLSNIFTKTGVTSRAAATAFAFEHDLVPRH